MDGPSTRLRLRVSPGASSSEVVGPHGEAWKVRVAGAAREREGERGRARPARTTLGVPRSSTEIVERRCSRDKVVLVHGLTASEAELRPVAAR